MAVRVGGRMLVAQFNVIDALKTLTHQAWRLKGACLTMDPDLFSLPDNYQHEQKLEMLDTVKVCESCPVKVQCGESASAEDKRFSIYGGELPTDLSLAPRGRPPANMVERGICTRGLHKIESRSDLDSGGSCRECRSQKNKLKYAARMVKYLPTKCSNGHVYAETGFRMRPKKRTGTPYRACLACEARRNEEKRNRRAAEKAAKMAV